MANGNNNWFWWLTVGLGWGWWLWIVGGRWSLNVVVVADEMMVVDDSESK